MNSSDTIKYRFEGFDNKKYLQLQKEKILERFDLFREGKLYLEIGGKFLYDPHAARTLPGFDPEVKPTIFQTLKSMTDLLFCVNAKDIQNDRALSNSKKGYSESVIEMADQLGDKIGIKPRIVINLCDRSKPSSTKKFENTLKELGYEYYKRYIIPGYPNITESLLSEKGYGADDFIVTTKKLILVTGTGSNSDKLSTCLGSIYQDSTRGIVSGYAKYETFPIWSLPISHPVNLAYEAATVDIGDYNVIDTYHEEAYGKRSVNYNRDVEAFEIIKDLSSKFLDSSNPMSDYKSPTDMGINYAGSAITDDQVVCIAGLHEIRRRAGWYREIINRGSGDKSWLKKCDSLENQAIRYIRDKGYDPEMKIT